jgi:hypothetical protein
MKNVKNSRIVSTLVLMLTLSAMAGIVSAQEADGAGWWNEFVAMGITAFAILGVGAIIVWGLFGENEKYGNAAKAASVIMVFIGLLIAAGAFAIIEDGPPPAAAAARPEFAATANAPNNTTHGTLGVNAYTWDVTWDISDASVLAGMDQLTFNITVYRDDQLADFYYTNTYIDEVSIQSYTQDSGITSRVISYSGGIPDVTWTDSLGNPVNDLELATVPQSETKRETVTVAVTLADAGIAGMVDNSVVISTFNIIIADSTTDSDGNLIQYTNPTTIPVTIVVATQA